LSPKALNMGKVSVETVNNGGKSIPGLSLKLVQKPESMGVWRYSGGSQGT